MIQRAMLLAIAGALFFVGACGDKDSKWSYLGEKNPTKVIFKTVMDKLSDQIGDRWDQEVQERDQTLIKSIFLGGSEFRSTTGQLVYLGQYGETLLFATAAHVVSEEMDICDDLISAFTADKKTLFSCEGFILTLPNSDFSFLSMKAADSENKIEPVPLQLAAHSSAGQQLHLLTHSLIRDEIFADHSSDCVLLADEPKILQDPDSSDESQLESWSLPIGCDAQHGNSGAPVINDDGFVVGFLWTGKYPKRHTKSNELMEMLKQKNELVWQEFNFMAPSTKILEELEVILKERTDIEPLAKDVLSEFLKASFPKASDTGSTS